MARFLLPTQRPVFDLSPVYAPTDRPAYRGFGSTGFGSGGEPAVSSGFGDALLDELGAVLLDETDVSLYDELWTEGAAAAVARAPLLLYSRPNISIFPKPAGVEWLGQWDFRDPATYGGTLPANGTSVSVALAVGGFPFAAVRDPLTSANVPTFALNGMGPGKHALRFNSAGTQYLTLGGLHTYFNSSDASYVILTVFNQLSTGANQAIFSMNYSTGTPSINQLYVTTGQNYRANGVVGASAGQAAGITLAAVTSTNMAFMTTHGRGSAANRVNRLAFFRNGDSLRTNQSITQEALDFATFFTLDRSSFGARRVSSVWQSHFDGHLMLAAIGRLKTGTDVLTSADETEMINWAKIEGAIS